MKRAGIILILVIILGCILLIPPLIGQGNYGAIALSALTGSGKFVVTAPYPSVPEYLPVYRIKNSEITDENATQLALSMGIRGNISSHYSDAIYIVDNSRDRPGEIEIFKNSGAFRYYIPGKLTGWVSSQPLLPSHDDAKKIADKYLGDRNLLRDDFRFKEVKDGARIETHQRGVSKPITSYVINLFVIYERYINGTPTTEDIVVYIGENSEVVGLKYQARAIEDTPFRYVKIIRPEEAYRNLVDGKVLMSPILESPVVITNISLQYYLKDVAESQNFVMPVYVFSGSEPSIYVSAVDPEEQKTLLA